MFEYVWYMAVSMAIEYWKCRFNMFKLSKLKTFENHQNLDTGTETRLGYFQTYHTNGWA